MPICSTLMNRFEEILLDAVLSHKVTSLHFAARVGNLPSIDQLLDMGFPMNSVDDSRHSPRMLHSREGHAYACKLLLQRGADLKIVNLSGERAISPARKLNACPSLLVGPGRSQVNRTTPVVAWTAAIAATIARPSSVMLKSGLLTWGKSNRRKVACKEAVETQSPTSLKNKRKVNEAGK
ncbi:hypothetical protein SADUNF_Sadunf16G0294000 [Salix dunnii]|uniref:Ankyrin repeat family protein n=1 Tax=Salix dunnii TaxID=1413687 RepID=A0A835JEV8_9ROSI|nr:hypothetical protein SADUNF_Sadunf16G0294000 [Salix dunnii]